MNEMPVSPEIVEPEAPKKNNTMIIIAVIVGVVVCCCCAFLPIAWFTGDYVIQALGG